MRSNVFQVYLSPRCMIQILCLGGADVTSVQGDATCSKFMYAPSIAKRSKALERFALF